MNTAQRVTKAQAERAFAGGTRVLVSDRGGQVVPVGPLTVTHHKSTTTWRALADQVTMWANRYPRQAFYVVDEAPTFPRNP